MDGGHDGGHPGGGAPHLEAAAAGGAARHGGRRDRDRTGWALAHLWLAVAAYGIGGFGDGVEVVALRSLLNERAPAPVAGRVFTAYTAITVGAASLGMAAAAPLVAVFGTRATLAFVGAAGAAAGVWGWPDGHTAHSMCPTGTRSSSRLRPCVPERHSAGCARSSSNVGGVSEHPARRRGHSRGAGR